MEPRLDLKRHVRHFFGLENHLGSWSKHRNGVRVYVQDLPCLDPILDDKGSKQEKSSTYLPYKV